MKPRTSPAQSRAEDYIRTGIQTGQFGPGTTLPSIRKLARAAGVSLVPMWKGLTALRNEGLVDSPNGRNYRIIAGEEESDSFPEREPFSAQGLKWQLVTERISADISNGRFGFGRTLPPVKELLSTYTVSYRTLRKAIGSLIAKGIIAPRERGFAVTDPPRVRRLSRRVILVVGFDRKSNQIDGIFNEECVRFLEMECLRMGLVLHIIGYYQYDGRTHFDFATGQPCDVVDSEDVLGVIHVITAPDCGWDHGFRKVIGFPKPVSVIDECGNIRDRLLSIGSNPELKIFSVGIGDRPGYAMGRYLASLGHRRIAYISPYRDHEWSMNRFRGLARAIQESQGEAQQVALNTDASQDFHAEAIGDSRIEKIIADYHRHQKEIPLPYQRYLDSIFHVELGPLLNAALWGKTYSVCEPLYEQALQDPTYSAWVGANDTVAIGALHFLRARRKSCPHDLTLVGFDDVRSALENKLTSFNFNIPALIAAALRHLVNPQFAGSRTRALSMEVDGSIVERSTSGPVSPKSPSGATKTARHL